MKTPSQIKAEIARLEKLASTYPNNTTNSFRIAITQLKWVLDGKEKYPYPLARAILYLFVAAAIALIIWIFS